MHSSECLYQAVGRKALRVQGTFVSDEEVEALTNFIRAQECVQYIQDDFEFPEPSEDNEATNSPFDADPYAVGNPEMVLNRSAPRLDGHIGVTWLYDSKAR